MERRHHRRILHRNEAEFPPSLNLKTSVSGWMDIAPFRIVWLNPLTPFRSLRFRLLVPLLAASLVASVAVAIASYWMGNRWAEDELIDRFAGIEATLAEGTFPLNRQVLTLLAELTDADIVTMDSGGRVIDSTFNLPLQNPGWNISNQNPHAPVQALVTIGDQPYHYGWFYRKSTADRDPSDAPIVAVLFHPRDVTASRYRAAMLPLITGLSTIVVLATVMMVMADRIVRQLSRLRMRVDRVAEGHFDAEMVNRCNETPIRSGDEIGRLEFAIDRMSEQLRQMWASIHRQQGQKLLHQVAGGLAHSLRNSLTGATMAIELHRRDCPADDESITVALTQLEQTESHVRRLLQVAAGNQNADQPMSVADAIADIRPTLDATAKHLRVSLSWELTGDLDGAIVVDGPSLTGAVANLVLNAMEAATEVAVIIDRHDRLDVTVTDNGDGPPDSVAGEVFEPFVTSKPEGLGLGLPLVVRSVRRLGGDVQWRREDDRTVFRFHTELTFQANDV